VTGDHYFSPQPQADHRYQRFQEELRGREFTFITDEGVFSKKRVDPGTRLLIESIAVPEEGSFLDLGCGYGPIGIVLGSLAPQAVIHMVDVNSRAVELARRNLGENGITNARVYWGQGLEPVQARTFNLIACNPPYRAGRQVVLSLLEEAYRALAPGGQLYIVGRTRQGVKTLAGLLREMFGNCREVAKQGGYRVYVVEKDAL
jgi:16S rRNA (guanine1207-N2)-methyltransferase